MNEKWKSISRMGLIYLFVILATLVSNSWYQQVRTQNYIDRFEEEKGLKILDEISDTYKITMENYSNYKQSREMKQRLIDKLSKLSTTCTGWTNPFIRKTSSIEWIFPSSIMISNW
ncbi:hypothetical protein ACFQ49_00635 [Kroppenstedtia eburnea]|uniref:hypothetical protein n=1 Tax=Kroppenstedtia eburnea TaxID=714067 RepID=UPI0036260DAA